MYFVFRQNNSGGGYIGNKFISKITIIEADSPQQANERAQDIGIYFEMDSPIEDWNDCESCGKRWDEVFDGFNTLQEAIRPGKSDCMVKVLTKRIFQEPLPRVEYYTLDTFDGTFSKKL